ncbi:MAG: bifunctional UDP-3-O-[3-hydroxymyristoyl] N-acetylglucosamine deacetylase/3-hydroxyacyl-ACP dehydratase [Isosphaeraceae bacterium]
MFTARRQQRTIAGKAEVQGVGFLQGSDVCLRFHPADADTGILFVRTDLPGRPGVQAHIRNVVPRQRRTTIQDGAACVEMVEHVMAALGGLHVDNCRIEIDAPETPGCDGSSGAFVAALSAAGTVAQDRLRDVHVIDKPVTVREGQAVLTAHPGDGASLVMSYQLDYGKQTAIGVQSLFLDVSPETFVSELATSRTFLLEAEAQALRKAGVGSRASESDLLIFGPDGVIGNTLRYPDECVRHKILDMVGDLALLGKDIVGHVVAHRSGHQLNAELVRALILAATGAKPIPRDPETDGASVALDVAAIMRILPHRYPFLMIDRVLEIVPGERVVAIKNVTANEPFFQGHWPGRPVMPGVMIIEALAQAGGVMIAEFVDRSKVIVIAAIDDVKIRRPVVPGDQIQLKVNCLRLRNSYAQVQGEAMVGNTLVAEAKIAFVMVEAERPAA